MKPIRCWDSHQAGMCDWVMWQLPQAVAGCLAVLALCLEDYDSFSECVVSRWRVPE
jgi:hypothetical protein